MANGKHTFKNRTMLRKLTDKLQEWDGSVLELFESKGNQKRMFESILKQFSRISDDFTVKVTATYTPGKKGPGSGTCSKLEVTCPTLEKDSQIGEATIVFK